MVDLHFKVNPVAQKNGWSGRKKPASAAGDSDRDTYSVDAGKLLRQLHHNADDRRL